MSPAESIRERATWKASSWDSEEFLPVWVDSADLAWLCGLTFNNTKQLHLFNPAVFPIKAGYEEKQVNLGLPFFAKERRLLMIMPIYKVPSAVEEPERGWEGIQSLTHPCEFWANLENAETSKQRFLVDSPAALLGGFKQQRLTYPNSLIRNRLFTINLFPLWILGRGGGKTEWQLKSHQFFLKISRQKDTLLLPNLSSYLITMYANQ